MDVVKYLDSFPLVSNEGFFDSITGKSKPKDRLDAKDINKTLANTYNNPEWLAKFKTPTGPVKFKWGTYANKNPEQGFKEYVKSIQDLNKHIANGFNELKKIAEAQRGTTTLNGQAKLIADLAKVIKDYTLPKNPTYTEKEPVTKEDIPVIYRYLIGTTLKEDGRNAKILDEIDEYNSNWYSANSPYRKELEARDEELGTIAIIIRDALVEYTRLFDEDDLIVRHTHYKESLIRYVNASLV